MKKFFLTGLLLLSSNVYGATMEECKEVMWDGFCKDKHHEAVIAYTKNDGKMEKDLLSYLEVPLFGRERLILRGFQRKYEHTYDGFAKHPDKKEYVICGDCQEVASLEHRPDPPEKPLMVPLAPPPPDEPIVFDESSNTMFGDFIKSKESLSASGKKMSGSTVECNAGSIYFDFNSSRINPDFKKYLSKLSKEIGSDTVRVEGYTCDIGKGEYNEKLSIKRADAVANLLEENGVNVSAVMGKGECCPKSDIKEDNRRSEVKILRENGICNL